MSENKTVNNRAEFLEALQAGREVSRVIPYVPASGASEVAPAPAPALGAGRKEDAAGADLGAHWAAMLDARRICLENPPPKPVPVFKLNGQQISTAGNLTVLAAQAKAGKTAALGGALAAVLLAAVKAGGEDEVVPWDAVDTLGFEAAPMDGMALIYFDTEQSPFDAWQNLSRAASRAGVSAMPGNLFAYRLLDVGAAGRNFMLEYEMQRRAAECGGVYAVILDGVADLVLSVNDEKESIECVEKLVRLAVQYDCPIVLVLHENPGGDKMRGHLGSQLERKAESNLRLAKGADGVTEIFAERCRNASIPKGRGVCFEWSDEAGMHVRVEGRQQDKAEAKREAERLVRDAAFAGAVGGLAFGELVTRIVGVCNYRQKRNAEKRIELWVKLGLVRRDGADKYLRGDG